MRRGRFPQLDQIDERYGFTGRATSLYERASLILPSQSLSNRPLRRIFFASVAICILLPLFTFRSFTLYRDRITSTPPIAQAPPEVENVPPKPEFYPWETTSYFNPISQIIEGKSTEQLCESFPQHLLRTIQPVLKMGHGENRTKIESQLESVSACIDNLIIFSDLDEKIQNHTVYDILADLPASYQVDNADFDNYLHMKELRKNGSLDVDAAATKEINGWILDKYKFLPMVERAWAMRPRRKWYVFYETDTYIVWDNMFRLLENLDPDTPLYMGSPSPGRKEGEDTTWFANGGPGFVLSRAAVLKLLKRNVGEEGDFLEAPLSHRWLDLLRSECCGDSVIGWALHNVGVHLSGYWPMFNPHPLAGIPYHDRYWCQPVITLHKTSPEDMVGLWRWEHSRRELGRPLLYKDLYEYQHPGHPSTISDWENGDWDGYPGPQTAQSFEECGKACESDDQCMQYNFHADTCWFVRSIRYGQAKAPLIEDWREPKLKPGVEKPEDGGDLKKSDIVPWTKEEARFMAGWMTSRIDNWRNERKCEVVQWVRPSITRIF